jgi:hypothetical protein
LTLKLETETKVAMTFVRDDILSNRHSPNFIQDTTTILIMTLHIANLLVITIFITLNMGDITYNDITYNDIT